MNIKKYMLGILVLEKNIIKKMVFVYIWILKIFVNGIRLDAKKNVLKEIL